jgi:hypothetical protein
MSATELRHDAPAQSTPAGGRPRPWQRPAFEVICLACEISAYAPDEGEPLF